MLRTWFVYVGKLFKKIGFIACIVLLSSILAVVIFFGFNFFQIQAITINGVSSLNGLSAVNKQLIFLVNTDNLRQQLLKSNPSILSISIQKEIPSTLRITAIPSRPSSQLEVSNGWYILSATAKVMKKTRIKTPGVATINYFTKYPFESYSVGDTIDVREIVYATYLLDRAKTIANLSIHQVAISHLFVIVCKNKTQEYWFTTKKSKEQQFDTLKSILRQFTISGRKYKKIDLRFSKPLVTLEAGN